MSQRRKIVAILAIAGTGALVGCALIEIDRQRTNDEGMVRPMPRYTVCPEGVPDPRPNTVCLDGG